MTRIKLLPVFIFSIFLFSGCTNSIGEYQNTVKHEPTQETKTNIPVKSLSPSNIPQKQVSSSKSIVPKYEIIHKLKGKRFDKGVNYYVLISKVDLSKNDFQKNIKTIIKKMVEENESKISIDFFDTKEALELLYKLYGDMSLGRTTKAENEMLAEHAIAGFSGELTTDIYLNSLYFFPSATADNKKVGKYVETIEFNPKDYNP